jgi:hypothetical protein
MPYLIGMKLEDAQRLIVGEWQYRVVKIDGVDQDITLDLKHDRISLEIENGKIIKQEIG